MKKQRLLQLIEKKFILIVSLPYNDPGLAKEIEKIYGKWNKYRNKRSTW